MAKQPSKQEEGIKDKLKSFLGLKGKPTGPYSAGARPQKEIVFTPELLKEIGPDSPANNRIKTIKELCDVVLTRRLEENAVETLWLRIKDLLQPQMPAENRHLALTFLQCVIRGQYKSLGLMRAHFFGVVKAHTLFEDLPARLEVLKALSDDGKDLLYFEEDAGPFLVNWMPDVMSSGKISDFLPMLVNVVKFNAAYLDQEIVAGLVQHTCIISYRTRSEEDVTYCLKILDAVVCYTYLPSESLLHFITCLCRTVNVQKFCESSWQLMRKLLGTHLGHSSVYTMCCIIQDRNNINDFTLLRGAVFFVGMALWGSRKVTSLKHPPASVLPSFLQALNCNNNIVAYEVVLSLHRLVKKYGKELQLMTWDIVLDIMEKLLKHIEADSQVGNSFVKNVHDILTTIEQLYEAGNYSGNTEVFFNIIESCSGKRNASSILVLVSYKAQSIHPAKETWLQNLYYLMDRYYRLESRSEIRIKVLDVLSCVLSANRHLYEDELIETVVLPHLANIDQDSDSEVQPAAVTLLVDLAHTSQTHRCMEILELLKKVISRPMEGMAPSSPIRTDLPPSAETIKWKKSDEKYEDIKTAALGLVDVFKVKLHQQPPAHACKVYELLVSHINMQYSDKYPGQTGQTASAIRLAVFDALLQLRADKAHRLGLPDKTKPNTILYSSYIICDEKENVETTSVTSSTSSPPQLAASPLAQSRDSVINFADTFALVIKCLKQDKDWQVLKLVLEKLPLTLQNKTLVLTGNPDIDEFCKNLCAMVSDASHPGHLYNTDGKLTKSDFHSYVFPVLTCLASYHSYLDKNKQRDLIRCLEFGLVSKCARMCVSALTVCTLEMQDVMMRLLPMVLIRLSQISATISMAVPMLEFLSSLIRLPKLYANFVEEQYMSIFAIALPYTNPFKFNHYTVSLAHHVIAMWFLKCRLAFRKDFVRFIIQGLKANVLRQFEETAALRAQQKHENQDSDGRGRTNSAGIMDMASKRKQARPASLTIDGAPQDKFPYNDDMSTFHKELTDTCVDMMARYTFSNCSTMPDRLPVAEFLLEGGQQQTWMLGNKLITITTSGTKVGKNGVCEKCTALARAASEKDNPAKSGPVQSKSEVSGRRRHKSAAVRSSSGLEMSQTRAASQDDIRLHRHSSSEDGRPRSESDISNQSSRVMGSTESKQEDVPVDSLLLGLKPQGSDKSVFGSHICNCWCQCWAEVLVRRPTGNISWMMRIQNPQSLSTSMHEFPLLDICSLFHGVPEKAYDRSTMGRIDSECLADNEYEELHEQHFPSHDWDPDDPSHEDSLDIAPRSFDMDLHEGLFTMSLPRHQRSPLFDSNAAAAAATSTTGFKYGHSTLSSIPASDMESAAVCDPLAYDEDAPMKKSASSPELSLDINQLSIPLVHKKPSPVDEQSGESEAEFLVDQFTSTPKVAPPTASSLPTNPPQPLQVQSDTSLNHSKDEMTAGTQNHHNHDAAPDSLPLRKQRSSTIAPQSDDVDAHPFRKQRSNTFSVMSGSSEEKKSASEKLLLLSKEATRSGLSPSFVFLQLYHSAFFGRTGDRPIVLPQSEVIERAMRNLDRLQPYETHKIGVLFVGHGQAKDETAILSNVYGSPRYAEFHQGLGHLIHLKDCNPDHVYLGGLDLNGSDGKFAYSWQDDFMQVIFHVATLMPNKEKDPNCNSKKLHIGNDNVIIIYNDSKKDVNLGIIKCQFHYVMIIITPLDHESNAVTVKARDDIKEYIGHTDTKIISDIHLAILVRQMALHANLASRIFQRQQTSPKDPYASNWLERLRQIKRIRSKLLQEGQATDSVHKENSHSPNVEDFTDFV